MADPRKAAPGARRRGFQHLGAGGDHDSGAVGPPRRGLRSLALVPGAVLALCPQISPLPGVARRPGRFLAFVERLLSRGHFDVLLPTHEQGFLFARVRERLEGRVGLGAAVFRELSHRAQQGRVQPAARSTEPAAAADADRDIGAGACATPSAFRPSSRPRSAPRAAASGSCAMRMISNVRAAAISSASDAFADEVLVQDLDRGHYRESASRYFAAANCSAFMPIGRSPPASAAARRSSKASAGRWCAAISRKSARISAGTARCRSTSSCRTMARRRC